MSIVYEPHGKAEQKRVCQLLCDLNIPWKITHGELGIEVEETEKVRAAREMADALQDVTAQAETLSLFAVQTPWDIYGREKVRARAREILGRVL